MIDTNCNNWKENLISIDVVIFCFNVTITQITMLLHFYYNTLIKRLLYCHSTETIRSHVLHQDQKLAVRRYEEINSMIGMYKKHLKTSMNVIINILEPRLWSMMHLLRFTELCSVMDPGKPPKTDKFAILSDAARLVKQLRLEAKRLKGSNEALQNSIKSVKVSNELIY